MTYLRSIILLSFDRSAWNTEHFASSYGEYGQLSLLVMAIIDIAFFS